MFTDKQGHSETHIFDNSGSTVSVLNSSGYATSSENTGLVINNSANAYTKNYITESSQQTEVGGGKYYFVSNGTKGSTASKGGKVTVDNSAATEEDGYYQYLGTTSLKVENPTSENNSAFFTGFAHQFKETTFNGKDVTFSAYVKTKNVKQIYSGGSVGAILKVKCLDSSGKTVKEINSIGLTGTLDWQRISVTANVPSTTASIRVYGLIRYASGTAWFDCIQFEEGNCANNFNALQNSDFSSNDNWLTEENKSISANKGTVTIGGTAGAFDDENADSSSDDSTDETQPSTYTKTVTETEPNDSITTYDDYGNAIKSEQGFVTRTVKKTYEVEENETTEEVTNPSDSDTDNSDDNDNSDTTDDNSLCNKYIYQNIKVGRAGVSFKINGTAKSNSVPLSNENRTFGIALNIYYNNSSTPEFHYQNFSANTDGYQQVSLSVTPEKTNEIVNYIAFAFVYGYNENEMTVDNAEVNISPLIQSSEDSKNETSEKEAVDEEVLSESIDKSNPYMQTSSEYDSTGNYVTSETNEQGSTTKYSYDTNGNKTAVTDGNGNVTNYTYDTNGNVLSIKNGTSGNDYSYTGSGYVSKITHNGFSYSFNYDVFYNLLSTKIGNVAITSNTYDSNGNLAKTTYANGDYFEYTYDDYGNITLITGETGKIAEMIYNKQGLVTKAVDYSSGETSYYYYTFDGSLEREYRTSSDGSLTHYIITNADGNTVEKTSVNGQTKTITTGTDKDGKSFVSNDGVTNETSTDDFGRTTQVRTVRSDGTLVFNTDYEYANGKAENSTTNLVSKYSQSYGSDSVLSYDYSYDANGNITEIKQNGKLTNKYVYDSLNELKEEYDYVNKFYINYSYDRAGNLQNKYEQVLDPTYGYPTGTQNGNTYEYTDTSWKDKLTKVNGSNISYDANGNPLSYRDGMSFEWENGRILKNINTSDKAIQMSYDSNGMRTQKTVDGVKTNYYYDSNKNLIALVKGNDTLLFYYDSDGSATSFSYNGTMYFYVKNLQGDVIRIIDLAGTEVASYVYDAWGNIKDTKGEPTIREINPIRYRGYVYDTETSLYYLQSRYYDPFTGRFLNADVYADTQSGTPLSTNMFSYCENNTISNIDFNGYALINVICSAIGGIAGWFFGDWIAKKLGYKSGWKYWAIRAGVTIGGAVIGWFAGTLISKILVSFLKKNPGIMMKLINKFSPVKVSKIMNYLGINPFSIAKNSSKFIAIARQLNDKSVKISLKWAKSLYKVARKFGYTLKLDPAHGGYSRHIHIYYKGKKFGGIHISLSNSAYKYFKKIL